MGIKDMGPRPRKADGDPFQGYYTLAHPEKYIGDPRKVIFRSSYERKFMYMCDTDPRILAWSSEPGKGIPYHKPYEPPGTVHLYYPDFFVKADKNGRVIQMLVEVKPAAQLRRPAQGAKMTPKQRRNFEDQARAYLTNVAKWKAARAWCDKLGWEFVVATETFIFGGQKGAGHRRKRK